MYFEKKPNLAHLRVFGSIAYVHVPKEKWRKLDANAEKCIWVGTQTNKGVISVITPKLNKVA